jgi:NAD(P)-dependent dehydrogenase (short-subunit alcohol dehydrogenase family)
MTTATANKDGRFAGKVAFVTGAASGIGRATALEFASEGASVVVADVSEQRNQETARMIENRGGRALAVRCDVTKSEAVKAALDKALDAFGIINTEMMDRFTGSTPEGRAKVIAQEPIGRMGMPEEIAAAVLWLCSDAASFVIGHALVVDGGQTV